MQINQYLNKVLVSYNGIKMMPVCAIPVLQIWCVCVCVCVYFDNKIHCLSAHAHTEEVKPYLSHILVSTPYKRYCS